MQPRRRWVARSVVVLVVCLLLAPVVTAAVTGADSTEIGPGTVTRTAEDETVVGVQGWVIDGETNAKKPARLVAADSRARTAWVYDDTTDGSDWFYDVDPLPNGNLLVVSPGLGGTTVYELDPRSQKRVWERRLPIHDTHDVDRLTDEELVVAAMREWNPETKTNHDRIFVYNLTTNETTWEWEFRHHFPPRTDGGHREDWSHVNDVDPLPGDRLLVSPRNFDQVLVVDRETGEIEMRLGADDHHEILHEQHNPDYLVSNGGVPTILVADSENDRVVEYAREDGEWVRTWTLTGLDWPRDADRLPNGNTLVTDSLNHRVIEVTPRGDVVWEYVVTWGPYEAERVAHGDGSAGPTMRDLGVAGSYEVHGGVGLDPGVRADVPAALRRTFAGTPLEGTADTVATRWAHVVPWIRPIWLSDWGVARVLVASVVLSGWGVGELVVARRRLVGHLRAAADAVRR
ncbi:aryl-sulfate sulfotransferase [Salinigranum salinum]|uniref:aryl-sulfate sulfotransferase n=1 Tax=Salinigranum salinum TaxID=1364937 RepID=UPI0012612A33|nr:aryl-sulfate sulfotransferase [Salinigranum salinum]